MRHNLLVFLVYGTEIGQFVAAWMVAVGMFFIVRFMRAAERIAKIESIRRFREAEKEGAIV